MVRLLIQIVYHFYPFLRLSVVLISGLLLLTLAVVYFGLFVFALSLTSNLWSFSIFSFIKSFVVSSFCVFIIGFFVPI